MIQRILIAIYILMIYTWLSNICAVFGDSLQWLAQLLTIAVAITIMWSKWYDNIIIRRGSKLKESA